MARDVTATVEGFKHELLRAASAESYMMNAGFERTEFLKDLLTIIENNNLDINALEGNIQPWARIAQDPSVGPTLIPAAKVDMLAALAVTVASLETRLAAAEATNMAQATSLTAQATTNAKQAITIADLETRLTALEPPSDDNGR